MSPTLTRTRTTSPCHARRHTRLRSLSLISLASPDSLLLALPTELLLDILELGLVDYKHGPARLASVSKAVAAAVETLLYRNVHLSSERQIERFCNTARTKPAGFLRTHVKRLAISWQPEGPPQRLKQQVSASSPTCARIWEILLACRGVRSISLPPTYEPAKLAALVRTPGWWDALEELVVPVYQKETSLTSPYFMTAHLDNKHHHFEHVIPSQKQVLTHLRICEPGSRWCAPSTMLETFGEMPELTHLQLGRRAGSNEDNDAVFVEDVQRILVDRPKLRMLVVAVFVLPWQVYEGDVEDSAIWKAMLDVSRGDGRLSLMRGEYESWKSEWDEHRLKPVDGPTDFWAWAERHGIRGDEDVSMS